jgi:hypothetical protein
MGIESSTLPARHVDSLAIPSAGWQEGLRRSHSDAIWTRNEPVFRSYQTAIHQNGAIEQHLVFALAKPSPASHKFETPSRRS